MLLKLINDISEIVASIICLHFAWAMIAILFTSILNSTSCFALIKYTLMPLLLLPDIADEIRWQANLSYDIFNKTLILCAAINSRRINGSTEWNCLRKMCYNVSVK